MKKTRLLLIGICFILVSLAGCKSVAMIQVEPVDISSIDSNTALVTFLRPAWDDNVLQFGMWDGEHFIGHLYSQSYIQYKTTPGKHLFLARSENWACVEAELEGGKSYFIIAETRFGILRSRVALDPISKGDNISEEKINQWLTKLHALGVDSAKAEAYAKAGAEMVRKAIDKIEQGKVRCNTISLEDYR